MSDTVIVCVRVSDAKEHISNATIANCGECDAPVWVSKSSHEVMRDKDGMLLCMQCSAPLLTSKRIRKRS
jgi:hypothetical protein